MWKDNILLILVLEKNKQIIKKILLKQSLLNPWKFKKTFTLKVTLNDPFSLSIWYTYIYNICVMLSLVSNVIQNL